MAGVDASKVLVGAPDQSGVAGAINMAPTGTTLPTSARDALEVAFKSSGYVSSDGISVNPNLSTTDLQDWSGTTVRTLLDTFEGTVTFSLIQFDGDGAKMVFGDDNVQVTPATSEAGEQVAISIGARLPARKAWAFNMKDGNARIRVVLPDAQPVSWDEMTFTRAAAIPLGTQLKCYPDSAGNSIYVYTDDGVFSS